MANHPRIDAAAASPAGGLRQSMDVLGVLVAKDLKVRYRNTILGYAWSVLHPLAFALVFFLVFGLVIRIEVENYGLFLIAGLFPWQWIANSTTASTQCFLQNRSLLRKVRFPRWLLVASGVTNDMIHFLLTIPVVALVVILHRRAPSASWLALVPLMTLATLLMTMGLSLLAATGNLFFRDLDRLVALAMMLWFYLTPVLYPVTMIPKGQQWLTYLNPMSPLILSWRSVLMDGAVSWMMLGAAMGWSAVFAAVGAFIYQRYQWRFAELV